MYDSNLIDSELPIHDIDIVVDDVTIGNRYKSGIAGTRVVANLQEYAEIHHQTVDCTINQALLYNGELLFTDEALRDHLAGEIRFIDKNETLFSPDAVRLNDGKIFITGKGFYRALTYLLRHKAHALSLYKENLDFLKKDKYAYASPLPKILSIANTEVRNKYVNEWFCLAKKLEITTSSSPEGFLEEIISENPGVTSYDFKTQENDAKEIRWIINQFLKSGIRSVVPDTYPTGMHEETVRIDMRELEVAKYELQNFFEKINTTFRGARFNLV